MSPDPKGLAAAREVAQWEIGSRAWADRLISAYLNPEEAQRALKAEKDEDERVIREMEKP
jgi:L-rhamnose isomerase